ncbi:Acylamino-acid-releasing enzyme [Triplophysa tibetana]|uniref:Acylamino-acid-releasing enzyme n=1 Tax=Triplophysa tibetana TaxID=1572043 RepID=A0A5A9NZ02_9TELE|nr:Acylamino-acid-releasing enzyme [Triplophysa tibetana]
MFAVRISLHRFMSRSAVMGSKVLREPGEIAQLYRDQCHFPSVCRADVGPVVTSRYGGQYCNIHTEWTQRDLERNESVKFCRQYIVFHDERSVVYSGASGNCTEIKGELLSMDSPSGEMKAVLRESAVKGEDKQFLEFGCLVWSHSETHLLYVAEKKRAKTESYFQQRPETDEEESMTTVKKDETLKGQQFEFYEDWGEALVNKSSPVLCVLDIESSNITAFWAPDDTGLVFVGWWQEPFRLGLKYCPNRKSSLFYVDLASGKCEQLSCDSRAVSSPRLSPDLCRIVYLDCEVYGPHQQCSRLCMFDWYTKQTSVVVDVVRRAREDGFTGIYSSALSPCCWSSDSQRVIISCAQRSRKDLLVVDTSSGEVSCITSSSQEGSWSLLSIRRDLMVVSCSSPNCPPDLRVGFLPAKGSETTTSWVTLEESQPQTDVSWQTLNFSPPPEDHNSQYPALDFDAVLLTPAEMTSEKKLALVVMPHGGPHSVLVSEWILSTAVLCKMGFGVLLVNYRGSLGFGQDNIDSLPGNIGTQDVKDVQLAVESVLKQGDFHEQKIAVIGGSHGGFLACHLIGQYPDFYKACVVRNPVTNLASMIGSTDIPDWCMVEAGFDYNTDVQLNPAVLEQMLNKSPIKHVIKVKTPVLLMLGEDDRRVPNKQGIEYYKRLKALQVPVRLLWYPGNNHSLSKVDAESDGFMNAALWILQHLSL